MIYFILFIVAFDFIRLINHFIHFYPEYIVNNYHNAKLIIGIIVCGATGLLLIGGYINTLFPRIRQLKINIHKKVNGSKTLHIVAASDIHLSTQINRKRATYLVEHINALKPDIILFAGDLLDEGLAPVLKYNIGEILKQLKATLGVFAIMGNHEYIGGIGKAAKYISEHNIQLVQDTAILIDNRFWLAGRDDKDKQRFTGHPRKALAEILADVDKSLPVILLDHQPFRLQDAVNNGVDLQISGHTHHAQLWPLGYITQWIYELDWGYKQKGNTHFYVSNGFGTWGPAMRIGNRPEIMDIHIILQKG